MPINVYTANRDGTWLFRATGNGPFNYTFPGSLYAPLETHDWKLYEWSGTIYGNRTWSLGGNDAIADDQVIAVNQSFTLYDVGYEYMTYYFKIYNIRYITSTITYDGNQNTGGSTGSNTATYNSPFIFQANGFTRTGYTFGGWHLYDGIARINQTTYAEGQSYGNWDKTGTNYTAKAQWNPATYTITYDANGVGTSGIMTDSTVTYGSSFTFKANGFTRTGYTFGGWGLYNGDTRIDQTIYPDQASYANWDKTTNLVAKAQWTPKTYSITIDKGDGIGTVNNPTATYGSLFTFPVNNLTRTGYTFFGWWLYQGSTRQPENVTYGSEQSYGNWNIDGSNFIIIAKWQGITYVLTYNANDGTSSSSTPVDVIYGNNMYFKNSTFYSRTGYDFKEWRLEDSSNNHVASYAGNASVAVVWNIDKNVTAKAQWTPKTSTITYSANEGGGTLAMNPQTATYDVVFTFQTNTNNFIRTGYNFKEWHLYEGETYLQLYAAGATAIWNKTGTNYTAKAQWTAKEYTITYDANGANGGTTNSNKATYDLNFTFQNNGFTLTGHEFSGWHLYDGITRINQTSTYGPTSASYLYGKWDKDKNLTAKAQWTRNVFAVTFNANGKGGPNGTGGTKIIAQNYNTIVICPIFKAVGFVFEGWATSATSTTVNKIGGATFTLGNADQTFFAIWTPNTNGIRFSELQTVFSGENPIRISEYRTESGQTIANSEIRLSANFKGKGPQP